MSDTVEVFLLILSLSFLFTSFLHRIPMLRVPTAVGYLLFGFLLQFGFLPVGEESIRWITQLGDIGLYFLMFLSGLEVDVSQLRPSAWNTGSARPLSLSLSIFLSTLLSSYGLALLLVYVLHSRANPWMLTLLFATSSLGIILPVLEETRIIRTIYGQTLLLSALIADLVTMILISVFLSARSSGSWLDTGLALIILPVGLLLYSLSKWVKRWPQIRNLAGDEEQRMRATIALIAAFCALADFSGSEPIVGSFVVGMLISALPFSFKPSIRAYSHGLGYGFLVPVFFISIGLNFDYHVMNRPSAWVWVPVLVVVAFLVKLVPALYLRKQFGRTRAFAGGVLLSARLSLIIAAADIGVRMGLLPALISESIVLVAVITCLAAPVGFVLLTNRS